MIKNQSQCPYCNECVIAYDWDADQIVFNPDLANPNRCKHVAYVGVYCVRLGQLLAHRHTIWLHPAGDQSLKEHLRGIDSGTVVPGATCRTASADHEYVHKNGTDAVRFFAIYCSDPEEFLPACLHSMREQWR